VGEEHASIVTLLLTSFPSLLHLAPLAQEVTIFVSRFWPRLSLTWQSINYAVLFWKSSVIGLCTTKERHQCFFKHNGHLL